MQFSKLILAAAAFAVSNAVQFTNPSFAGITAGTPFEITWSGASGPVTLTLKNGAAQNLKDVAVIAQGQSGTSFTWTPSVSLPADTYAISISDSTGTPNYSTQFQLIGGAAVSVSSSLSSASSSVAASLSSALASITGNSTSSATSASSASQTSSSAGSSSAASSLSSRSSSASAAASRTSAAASSATGSPTPAPSNGASAVASPLAMVFLALAAFMTLN